VAGCRLTRGDQGSHIRETPQRNYVSINVDSLEKDDPILAIEQSEFHKPIRAFISHVQKELIGTTDVDSLVGIVVFGSVARGAADRQSDIDVFVVVGGDRTTARRIITDVVADLQDQRFNDDRFVFEPYVESINSAQRAGSKLREIFLEGITVYEDEKLHSIRKEALVDE